MLFIYTIIYSLSTVLYYLKHNYFASVLMIALAIFLYVGEVYLTKRIINVRGLFAIGFIGGFGVSLLKLSKLSADYSIITFLAVFVSYFAIYFGTYIANKTEKNSQVSKNNIKESKSILMPQEWFLIITIFITFASFLVEAYILKFIPLFTTNTPHAYSTFHVFMLHYITTFYSFIPCIAICNYFFEPHKKRSALLIIISFLYVIIMSLLLVSRSQLILSIVLSIFTVLIYKNYEVKAILKNKKNILIFVFSLLAFVGLYIVITINRAHNSEYLMKIFEMKNEKTPVFISQIYMYIAHNFENLNYMINSIFRWTFGRRVLYPFFTLTFIKKFFPIVVDSPYYIIKPELSTVTIIYDFYYDFGLIGVIIFCFIIGYVGKKLENIVYSFISGKAFYKNNYSMILLALYCYYMFFSFFQTYFSLANTWVYIFILILISACVEMKKN